MIPNQFIKELINTSKPADLVWGKMLEIWKAEKDTKKHYEKESALVEFEKFLHSVYDEFFTEILPKQCKINHLKFDSDTCYVFMDGMSLREGALIFKKLQDDGYNAEMGYSYSAAPSSTERFREKIKYNELKKKNFAEISNHNQILLSGTEKLIWSRYPDVFFDKIKVGSTVLDSLEDKYKITEKVLLQILKQIRAKNIVVTSDHGYIRTEAGYNFRISDDVKRKIKESFGDKRTVSMDEADASVLVKNGFAVAFDGYYMLKSRYISTGTGQYTTYMHDGISLMECMVPKITIERK